VGSDSQANSSQLTAVFLDNEIDNNSAINAIGEKVWGDENIHSGIQVHSGDENVTVVTNRVESAMVLQQIHNHSSIIAIDDFQGLSSQQLNQNVILCLEKSLVNDSAAQASLISTIERLEACGKHVLLNYLPSSDISGGIPQSLTELVQENGIKETKKLINDLRSLDSVMGEVGEVEKAMSDELEELNKTADHHSIDDEKIIKKQTNDRSVEQDFEMAL